MSKGIGREFWTPLIQEFESREQEQTHWEFCEGRGLEIRTFRYWLYRLRGEWRAADEELALVPVEVTDLDQATMPVAGSATEFSPVDAAFPGGMVVRFQAGTDPTYMAELLSSVSRRLG